MKQYNYDERQLLARGKAYGIGCMAFLSELAIWELLRGTLGVSAEPVGEFLLLLSIPFAVVLIVCILEDAYDPVDLKPGIALFTVMPIAALCMFVMKFTDGVPMMTDRCLTDDAGLCALYAAWVVVSVVYWIKYAKDTKAEKENRS